MKSLIVGLVLLGSLPTYAINYNVINCSIGYDAQYSVLINLKAKTVQLWEIAGPGVSYPALVTDNIARHAFNGNHLTVDTQKTGRINLSFDGWGSGAWKHNRLLDRFLQYAGDENVNGAVSLVECVEWR